MGDKKAEHVKPLGLFSRAQIADRTHIRDDGRIDFVIDSTISRLASRLHQQDASIPGSRDSHDDNCSPAPPPPYSPAEAQGISIRDHSIKVLGSPPEAASPRTKESSLRLNIVIQVVGSRGDVQPFLALGVALKSAGHRVRIATHGVFKSFVLDSGLEFFSIGGDPAELMAFMVKNPGLIPSIDSLMAGDIQQKRLMVRTILDGCWRSCVDSDEATSAPFVADAIIANPPSFSHVHCAQALSIPLHIMFTMPWTSTKHFSHPLANLAIRGAAIDPGIANYASFWLVEWMTWQGLGDVINEWRATIDLEPVPVSEGPRLLEALRVPVTYCWSPALIPKPSDWRSNIDICGFFFRESRDYAPPFDLMSWLKEGPTPIYIGFGSIVVDDPETLTETIVNAVRAAGSRAVISKGWSNLGGDTVGPNPKKDIFYLGDCPHEWLFQNVSAVVHHGGAGTTACGLLNGRPTAVIPFFGDQPFWGDMVAAAGAGPNPIPKDLITTENLTEAIKYCLIPEVQTAAEHLSATIQIENGVEQAVRSFHEHILAYNIRCDIFPDRPAAWVYKSRGKLYKMSKLAGAALMDASLVTKKQLKPYAVNPIEIRNHRWDPFTGVASATLGTGKRMLVSTTDIIVKPVQTYLSLSSRTADPEPQQIVDPEPLQPEPKIPAHILLGGNSGNSLAGPATNRSCVATAAALASSSASGVGGFFKAYGKGFFLDIPLSAADGLRAVPRLYGEEVNDREAIRGWKSGAMVGGKQFVSGFSGGISDLINQPYNGAAEAGALGAVKGLGKGVIGCATKVLSAPTALVAYSFQGIYEEIRSMTSTTSILISERQHQEGAFLLQEEQRRRHCAIQKATAAYHKL